MLNRRNWVVSIFALLLVASMSACTAAPVAVPDRDIAVDVTTALDAQNKAMGLMMSGTVDWTEAEFSSLLSVLLQQNGGENNPVEAIKGANLTWHKLCFRCKTCNIPLNLKTHLAFEGWVYCRVHYPPEQTKVSQFGNDKVSDSGEYSSSAQQSRADSSGYGGQVGQSDSGEYGGQPAGGYDQGGYDQGGYDQGQQGGYDQGGYEQGQGGYDQGGYEQGY